MANESEYREQNIVKMEDTPEVIEEKINKYYFKYRKVTDAEYNAALELIKNMIEVAFKSKNTKLVLKYTKVWYRIHSLYHKRRRKGIDVNSKDDDSKLDGYETLREFTTKQREQGKIKLNLNSFALRNIIKGKYCLGEDIFVIHGGKKGKYSRK